jgi:hypothetical protein
MIDTIDKIENEMRAGELTENPGQCARYVASLSGELSFYLAQQGKTLESRAKNWLTLRKEYKSDNQAEKAWTITQEGIDYTFYDLRIKRVKALLVGLKTLIKNAEAEQMNLH